MLLKQYSVVFSWKPTDLTGIDRHVIEYSLNITPGSNPIIQKKRGQAEDRNRVINAELADLVSVDILREAMFPTWIANPVMVKKANRSWRMCIDYIDLNHVCPKDHYPLPEIDQKSNRSKGFSSNVSLTCTSVIIKYR